MGTLIQDLRFSLRSLRRAPAFPLAAIATLALGIGATTAIFTTLNAVLLKPLPYPNPDDLYSIRTTLTDGRVTTGLVAGSEIFRLNDPNLSIERAAALQNIDLTLLHADGTPQSVKVNLVTVGFFEVFGLPMTRGGFSPDQFEVIPPPPPQPQPAPGAQPGQQGPPQGPPQPPPPAPAIVISHRVWQNLFNSSEQIVGTPIRFAEFEGQIVGVAHRDFDTPHAGDFWLANRLAANDVNHGNEGFMRIKHGADIERVKSQMAVVIEGIGREFPGSARNRAYVTRPLVDSIVGDLGPILIIVMSATGLLLLLACVNVTNLLLARGAARAREMAVRVSLGAGTGRIVRQLLTESVVLATAGSILGVLVAYLGVRGLMVLGASKLPRLDSLTFDGSVLLFTFATLLVSGLLVGLVPAIRLARTDVRTLMNESSRSTSSGRSTGRWLSVMTVAEIALAIMLVAGAGWLVRGFSNLRNTNLGFVADNRIMFDVTFQGQRYPNGAAVHAARTDMINAVRSLQGVTDVGTAAAFPLKGQLESSLLMQPRGEAFDTQRPKGTRQRFVSPGFFSAMGTQLIQGRDFGPEDAPGSAQTAIVNRTFVARYLNGRDPIGFQFAAGYPQPNPNNLVTVVGVVDDIRQKSVELEAEPAYYTSLTQAPIRRMTMVVSTSLSDPAPLMASIRETVRKADPQIAVNFELVREFVDSTISRQQLGMTLMLIFGIVAVVLAAIGIYGVVAYSVAQRRDEMATRLALGASPGSVFWLVMKQGGLLALIGTVIGVGTAYLSGRVVASQLYAIRASDPVMLGAAIVVVIGITVLATMLPAWRASKLSPARALHPE
jgi:putative ABC transport system permease protein